MPHPKVKISDDTGNAVSVTSNRLDVNAYLSATPTIDIGDVSLLLDGTAADYGTGNVNTSGRTLRVTLASDDPAVALLTTIDTDTGAILVVNAGMSGSLATIAGDTTDIESYFTLPGIEWTAQRGIMADVVRNDDLASLFSVGDGDITQLQVNSKGGLYVTGSEVENAAVQSEPLLIGGRYDSSSRTLGDGDAGAIALNASGHVLMDVVDGGQLDALLDTIKVDTEAIETAVELLDNAISGNEMQVDIVSAPTLTVDGSGVTQPVSGTVTANLSATDNAVLDAMVVDLAAMEVLLTGMDVDTNAIKGYLNNLSNTLYTDDEDWSDNSSTHQLVGGLYQSSMQSVTDGDVAPFQVDANGVLRTSHSITGMQSDSNEGVDDSTAEVLKSSTACKRVDMQADPANTGYIYVGGSDVSAVKGIRLAPGDFYSIDIDNTADIYVLASVDEEDIHFTYYT